MNQGENFLMVATTFFGLEQVLSEELAQLGAQKISVKNRAVSFHGDLECMYQANLWLRSALRVLVPIQTFSARNELQLYQKIKQIPWKEYLHVNQTFAIDHAVSSPYFNHSQYAALKTKDAIADYFRSQTGRRPSVNVQAPDVRINLHIAKDIVTVSLDSSGDPLFKRGYRRSIHEAPLNEVLAAGMILLSGWDGKSHFIDPMCGSGTLPIEAAMIAAQIPPGMMRKDFGFFTWKNYQGPIWKKIKGEALKARIQPQIQIMGSDISAKNLELAQKAVSSARLESLISLEHISFEKKQPPPPPGILIMNPPYGERLNQDNITQLYQTIGDTLKKSYAGYDAWVLSSNTKALTKIGLRPDQKISLYNGALNCRFLGFTIYEGSRRNLS